VRQNTLLKNIFGLSKFSRSRALMSVLKIKSTIQLYEEYKIFFIKHVKKTHLLKKYMKHFKNDISQMLKHQKSLIFP
jgi:hypothetical protein